MNGLKYLIKIFTQNRIVVATFLILLIIALTSTMFPTILINTHIITLLVMFKILALTFFQYFKKILPFELHHHYLMLKDTEQ